MIPKPESLAEAHEEIYRLGEEALRQQRDLPRFMEELVRRAEAGHQQAVGGEGLGES